MASTSLLEVISNEKTLERRRMDELQDIDFTNKWVLCRCPKCGKAHSLKFFWTGTGTPRKYCHRCRESISGINETCIYEMSPDICGDVGCLASAEQG